MALMDEAIDQVLRREGGLVNHPRDPGGMTNRGITRGALAEAVAVGIIPESAEIDTLTVDQTRAIYAELYWHRAGCELVPPYVALLLFDDAVQRGRRTAVRTLQRALGVPSDGIMGPETIEAAKDADPEALCLTMAHMRWDSYASQPEADVFLRGWTYRLLEAVWSSARAA